MMTVSISKVITIVEPRKMKTADSEFSPTLFTQMNSDAKLVYRCMSMIPRGKKKLTSQQNRNLFVFVFNLDHCPH